jgi:hypothetical protein
MMRMGRIGVTLVAVALLSSFLCSGAWAEPVGPERALKAAEGFLKARTPASGPRHALSSAAAGRSPGGIQAVQSEDGTVLAYVASLDPEGFIITSADTGITPVVAYSLKGAFDPSSERSNPLYLLLTRDMKLRTLATAAGSAADAAAGSSAWSLYESGQATDQAVQQWPPEGTTSTGGWVETTWHQLTPYDDLCPLDPTDGQRSVVGCAATAMAQLLNYHRRCGATFTSGDAYGTYSGVAIDADHTRYSFPSFVELNKLLAALRLKYSRLEACDDSDAAVLSLACGFASKMDYTSLGSGAYSDDVTSALVNKFGLYSADLIGGLSSESIRTLQENVINGLPVLLGIATADGSVGHLIVCDGYNTKGEYHLNFGWTSSQPAPITQAWYRLPSNIPTSICAITDAIVNIQAVPPSVDVDPARMEFVKAKDRGSVGKMLFIRNNTAEPIHINSVSCPAGFLVASADGGAYSDHLGAFDIPRGGQEVMVNVAFDPQTAGGYYGTLAINYSTGKVRYVVLQGEAHAEEGTEIAEGEVSGTWSLAGSPYYIQGNIEVAADSHLTIEPGVQVIFMGHYGLTVGADAQLTAQGTADKRILFTTASPDLGFAGLRLLNSGDDDIFSYCTITGARKGIGPVGTDYALDDLAGGALFCYSSNPTLSNCVLANNIGDYGGAILCYDSDMTISNTLIANNGCMGGSPQAGGIYCTGSSNLEISNCTIVNNSPGGLYSEATFDAQVSSTIVWGNRDYQVLALGAVAALSYCDVQGGYDGEGNIASDPAFLSPTSGYGPDYDGAVAKWTLKSNSACINGGGFAVDGEADLAGNPRVGCDIVDIGAYESPLEAAWMTLTPAGRLDAGFAKVGVAQSVTLDVANTGTRDLTISRVDVNDAGGVFALVGQVAGQVVKPGDSAQIEISFTPTAEKVFDGTVHVFSTADNAADRQLSIRGTGTAGTVVSGSVSGTWTKAKSPYTVTGDISIARSKSLTIEPGVTVRFAGPFSFTVGYRATLKAAGTETDPILFTPTDTADGWRGIRFINTGADDVLRYCTVEYALKGYSGTNDWMNWVGGGIICCEGTDGTSTPSSPTIDHCRIANCSSAYGGAIFCIDESKATISNCLIVDNAAGMGGGIYLDYYCEPSITNNVIACNNATYGGGIYNTWAYPAIVNNTIVNNYGAAMYLDATYYYYFTTHNTSVVNNIVWGNEIYMSDSADSDEYDVRYNDIQAGWDGLGNIDVDPLFADSAGRDYHLKSEAGRWDPKTGTWVTDGVTSPCIDAGNPASAYADEPAPNGDRIDMGAFGGTAQASKSK